jgi:protein SCO1/2
MNKNFLVIAMALAVVIVAVGLGYSWYKSAHPDFSGSLITPPTLAPDFTLTDQANQAVKLSDYRGKYVLLFFGFTNCTAECPLTMGYLKQLHDRLGTQADKVQVILVTTDPARDTPQVLGSWLAHFDPSFIGLTASKEVLQKVWADYGVTVLDGGETHSSYLYLIDPTGNMTATYPLLQNVDGITSDMRTLLRNQ